MSENTTAEMIDRLRRERGEAFVRASLFAQHADRLEKALHRITECPCCEQYSCAETANAALTEATKIFNLEWEVFQNGKAQ